VHGSTLRHSSKHLRHGLRQNGRVRYLTICRHAKAEKPTAKHSDFDRKLSERGRRQCEQLREWASEPNELGAFGPTTALVSAAARTKETFRRAFDGTTFVTSHVYSELIYNGLREVTAEDLLIDLASVDPVTTSLLVVAHNPTVLELVWTLVEDVPAPLREGFPVGAACVLAIPESQQIGLRHYDLVARYIPD